MDLKAVQDLNAEKNLNVVQNPWIVQSDLDELERLIADYVAGVHADKPLDEANQQALTDMLTDARPLLRDAVCTMLQNEMMESDGIGGVVYNVLKAENKAVPGKWKWLLANQEYFNRNEYSPEDFFVQRDFHNFTLVGSVEMNSDDFDLDTLPDTFET